jgi:NAD(P)-dependent dehydrogenase (short-subunit alcohol dehydrogenase family)
MADKPSSELRGRVVMVTGANAGMGKEISLGLASMGASLVMVCRDRKRGELARVDVQQQAGNPDVELMVADLSSQKSIRQMVEEFKAGHETLHVLVNNAGMTSATRTETVDGLETVFATNHLGPFLLTNLLLPVLRASAPSRVVVVSSGVQAMGKLDFEDLQSKRSYGEVRTYNASKLANILFTYELARRVKGGGVTANAVEPGFIKTNLKVPFPFSIFSFMRGKAADGAKPSIFLASSRDVEGVSGAFFSNKGIPIKSSKITYDESVAERLWNVSAELTNLRSDALDESA